MRQARTTGLWYSTCCMWKGSVAAFLLDRWGVILCVVTDGNCAKNFRKFTGVIYTENNEFIGEKRMNGGSDPFGVENSFFWKGFCWSFTSFYDRLWREYLRLQFGCIPSSVRSNWKATTTLTTSIRTHCAEVPPFFSFSLSTIIHTLGLLLFSTLISFQDTIYLLRLADYTRVFVWFVVVGGGLLVHLVSR